MALASSLRAEAVSVTLAPKTHRWDTGLFDGPMHGIDQPSFSLPLRMFQALAPLQSGFLTHSFAFQFSNLWLSAPPNFSHFLPRPYNTSSFWNNAWLHATSSISSFCYYSNQNSLFNLHSLSNRPCFSLRWPWPLGYLWLFVCACVCFNTLTRMKTLWRRTVSFFSSTQHTFH